MSDSLARNSLGGWAPSAGGFLYLRVALGLLLLVTAALKAHGLTIDPLAQDSFLASPRVLVATIEIETILALWLLSGWSTRAAWAMTLGFFGILAAMSFYLGLQGQESCGCFGRMTVSPWVSFAIDLAVLAGAVVFRPGKITEMTLIGFVRPFLKTGTTAVFFLLILSGAFVLFVQDPVAALARLRGDSITLQPSVADVGQASVGVERMFSVQLTNRTNRPIRVIGGSSTCSCFATVSLPLTISEAQTREIEVWVKFRGSPGRFRHRYLLYTDDEKQPLVVGWFSGRVRDSPQ